MAVDYKKLKVGDKVRYLGGDSSEQHGGLIIGNVYDIVEKDPDGYIFFIDDDGDFRLLLGHNAHCFELVDGDNGLNSYNYDWRIHKNIEHNFNLIDEVECNCDTIEVEAKDGVLSETICNRACKHDSHIVSLAKEVAELKRELSELKEYVEKEAVLFDERLIEVESKKPSADKAQYVTVYGSEYIDKLFGGDSE